MASTRKAIGKKLRFEVFKRDGFTCQYCGKAAPDVILHVDHIDPVARGGGNDVMNLITSCADCNGGKGAVTLDDRSVIAKQRAQLAELSDRREQLQMMLDWRKGLRSIRDMETEAARTFFEETFEGYEIVSAEAVAKVSKLVKDFGLQAVMDAMELARHQYAASLSRESVNLAFAKLGGICSNRAKPDESGLFYARGIVRKRMYCNEERALALLRAARASGVCDDDLQRIAKSARNWSEWQETMLDLAGGGL